MSKTPDFAASVHGLVIGLPVVGMFDDSGCLRRSIASDKSHAVYRNPPSKQTFLLQVGHITALVGMRSQITLAPGIIRNRMPHGFKSRHLIVDISDLQYGQFINEICFAARTSHHRITGKTIA
jgi:hypothetical protein